MFFDYLGYAAYASAGLFGILGIRTVIRAIHQLEPRITNSLKQFIFGRDERAEMYQPQYDFTANEPNQK